MLWRSDILVPDDGVPSKKYKTGHFCIKHEKIADDNISKQFNSIR
jgi:hypothetical protein